jgi:TRAP-type C4-dicarboxylate transport system permease large subunit
MPTFKQQIRFCTGHDGVRIAYATSGHVPPLIKAANWPGQLAVRFASRSSVADTASIGSVMIPQMVKAGCLRGSPPTSRSAVRYRR